MGTTDTDCTVYEDSHGSEINASIAKYAPYPASEENSSKGVQYLGSEGPSLPSREAIRPEFKIRHNGEITKADYCHCCRSESELTYSCDICYCNMCSDCDMGGDKFFSAYYGSGNLTDYEFH